MRSTQLALLVVASVVALTSPAVAQKTAKGPGGKTACALLSADEVRKATGRSDVARRTDHMDEDTDFSSNCQYWGAFDITLHIGTQTKVMFGRERESYAKAPARLGYTVERVPGLGDDAYYLIDKTKVSLRVMRGEMELAVSLSGSLPADAEAKKMALNVAKAAVAKL